MHNMEQYEAALKDRFETAMRLSGKGKQLGLKFDRFGEDEREHNYVDALTSCCYASFITGWVVSKWVHDGDDMRWRKIMESLNDEKDY